jgi:hypothetical protein
MKRISVDEIANEMVLGRDVCGASGNVLLGKGTKISPAMGRRLKNWGIPNVYVEGEEDGQQPGAAAGPTPAEVKEKLEKKFSRVMDNLVMKKIFAAVYQYRIQRSN